MARVWLRKFDGDFGWVVKSTLWPTPSIMLLLKQIDDLLQLMNTTVTTTCFSVVLYSLGPKSLRRDFIMALFSATTDKINALNHSGLHYPSQLFQNIDK